MFGKSQRPSPGGRTIDGGLSYSRGPIQEGILVCFGDESPLFTRLINPGRRSLLAAVLYTRQECKNGRF